MPTPSALSTLNSNSEKGRKATDLFRAAYDKSALDDARGQFLNENKAFPQALRELIDQCSMPVKAPDGGRIQVVRVPVNPARDWQEAVNAAGPNTPQSYDVRKVGDQYPPQPGEAKEQEIILINFGKTIPNGQYALDWAKSYGLRPATARAVFAVGEHKPELNREFDMPYMAAVSLEECSFGGRRRVPFSCWDGTERRADLYWFESDWLDVDWFAFVRE